jgi:thiamine biosynthesis lipoprotein
MRKRPGMKVTLLVVPLILIVLFIAWLRQPEADDRVSRTALVLSTLVEISAYGDDHDQLEAAVTAAFDEMRRLEKQLSVYLPDSEISRLNRATQDIELSAETIALLRRGQKIAAISSGAFDMGLGVLKDLWQIETDSPQIPTVAELEEALVGGGSDELSIEGTSVARLSSNVQIDLGGIAKGYAADCAIDVLKEAGVAAATVNAGGDIALFGTRAGQLWRIGIRHPRKVDDILGTLVVGAGAVVTSGDYERFFERDGVRYHHIFDPHNGRPARLSQSVTVVTASAADADALATAAFVLGPQAGLELLEERAGVEGLIVAADGSLYKTSGLPWQD